MNLAKNVTGGTTGRAAGLVPAGAGQPAAAPRPEFAALAEVAVGHGPIGDIAAAPDRSALIVANHGDDSISILEPRDLAERATVLLPGEPIGVAAAAGRVYVATTSAVYDAVSVVDTDRAMILATYPLDLGITAIGGDGGRIVVGQTGRGKTDLAIVDTTTGAVSAFALATVAGVVVDAVHVSRDGRRVCVGLSDADGGEVQLMSGSRVPARVAVESPIRDIALSPDGNIAYALVCGTGGASLQIIDTRAQRVVRDVETGGWPSQMALSPDGTRAYIVDRNDVLVLCTVTHRVVDVLRFGVPPSGVATSPGRLYVADYAGSVTTLATPMPLALELPTVPTLRELQPAV